MAGKEHTVAYARCRTVDASFTRPSDTTAYAAGDSINNSTTAPTIITFSNVCGPVGAQDGTVSSVIQEITVIDSANEGTKLACELWLLDTTMTMDNDNAAFTPTDAEAQSAIAVIAIATTDWKEGTAGTGGNCVAHMRNLRIPVHVNAATNAIYGVLVARNAYTPISGEVFKFRLRMID